MKEKKASQLDEIERAVSWAAMTPLIVWGGWWNKLRHYKPWIGKADLGSLVEYLCTEHAPLLEFDVVSMPLPEINKLLEADVLACRSPVTADVHSFVSAKAADGEQQPLETPKVYLSGWREILDALTLDNNATNQRRVRDAHERFRGPIIMPAQGGQPKVVKVDLLVWWNGLEDRFREDATERGSLLVDRTATVENQFELGRGEHRETIVPGIAGRAKRRRGPA